MFAKRRSDSMKQQPLTLPFEAGGGASAPQAPVSAAQLPPPGVLLFAGRSSSSSGSSSVRSRAATRYSHLRQSIEDLVPEPEQADGLPGTDGPTLGSEEAGHDQCMTGSPVDLEEREPFTEQDVPARVVGESGMELHSPMLCDSWTAATWEQQSGGDEGRASMNLAPTLEGMMQKFRWAAL